MHTSRMLKPQDRDTRRTVVKTNTFYVVISVDVKKDPITSPTSKGTKIWYQDCLHHIANFHATVLNIFWKEIVSNNAKYQKV